MGEKYDVATVLEREMQATIKNWYSRVEAELEFGIPLSREDRCAHLPEMFADLVYRLRNPLPLGIQALTSAAAKNHGRLRREQGYTAAMMVDESRMLQVSIFQTLQRHVEDADSGALMLDVMVIADEVDSQLAQAMSSYISEAKMDEKAVSA